MGRTPRLESGAVTVACSPGAALVGAQVVIGKLAVVWAASCLGRVPQRTLLSRCGLRPPRFSTQGVGDRIQICTHGSHFNIRHLVFGVRGKAWRLRACWGETCVVS